MGIISSSVSYACFRAAPTVLNGELISWAMECILEYAFTDEVEGISRQLGWANIFEPFSRPLAREDIFLNGEEVIALCLRIEERKVAKSIIKKHCAIEQEAYMTEKGIKKVPRAVKKRIREQVEFSLAQKAMPVPSTYDMIWDIIDGIIYLFSTSSRVIGEFQGLFKRSFSIYPEPLIPYTLAKSETGSEALKNISPEVFA